MKGYDERIAHSQNERSKSEEERWGNDKRKKQEEVVGCNSETARMKWGWGEREIQRGCKSIHSP